MITDVLSSISGIEIFPAIGLIFFFLVFLGFLYWAFRLDKKYIQEMENLPLERDLTNNEINRTNKQ